MISWDRVEELRSEVGVEDFAEIVQLFLDETDAVLGRLAEASNADEAEALLHFLKGSSLNLGFADLSRLCEDPWTGDVPGEPWSAFVGQVSTTYERSKTALQSGP